MKNQTNNMGGQASVETILILSVLLVVLAAAIVVAGGRAAEARAQTELAKAKASTQQLADAADLVSGHGAGSKITARVELPAGFDPDGSFIDGTLLNLRIPSGSAFSDINAKTTAKVSGTWPKSGGPHVFIVENTASGVRIQARGE